MSDNNNIVDMEKIDDKISKLGTTKTLTKRIKLHDKIDKLITTESDKLVESRKRLEEVNSLDYEALSKDVKYEDLDPSKLSKEIKKLEKNIKDEPNLDIRVEMYKEYKLKIFQCKKHYESMLLEVQSIN